MSFAYDQYLKEHRENVKNALEWMKENLPTVIDGFTMEDALSNVEHHDESKYSKDEYPAYDAYFYGGNKSYDVVQEFNVAWLKHIHNNPHHWQYWILYNDDPLEGMRALDMPLVYIYEMIADWWSFSWRSGNLTEIFKWYEKHSGYIMLSTRTRLIVEDILEAMGKVLMRQLIMEQNAGVKNDMPYISSNEDDGFGHSGVLGMKWGVRNGPPYPIGESKQVERVKKLNDEMNSQWDYGVLHNGEHVIDTENFNWGKDYRTTPIETLKKEKIGTCWDYVNYQHHVLKSMGIPDESFMFVLRKSDDPDDIVTHTFTTFDVDGKKYWLESAAWPKRGVHEITDFKDVASALNDMYGNPGKGMSVFKYNPDGLDKGLTDKEYFDKATQKLVYDDKLSHSGIPGMKWGVRNYQNKDGTWTELGKERRREQKTVFVSGSSKTQDPKGKYYHKELPDPIKEELNKHMDNGDRILVGDAPGIDRQVQDYLNRAGYSDVEIYGPGKEVRYTANDEWITHPIDAPEFEEGSKEWLAKKDKAMSDAADEGLAVILGEGGSRATRNNAMRLVEDNKHVRLLELYKNGEVMDPTQTTDPNTVKEYLELLDLEDADK